MNKTQTETYTKALSAFNLVQEASQQERQWCLQDRRFCFIAGSQWESWDTNLYANIPRLEINKVQLAVQRIINEYKSNRISATFSRSDGGDSKDAEMLNDLYRSQSKADGSGYIDNAFIDAVAGGIGAWRLRTELEDEEDPENEQQVISFEAIVDADTCVFFDLGSKKQNKSDAKCCWVISAMPRKDYEDKYESIDTWPKDDLQTFFDWYTPDVVYVAEYYEVEEKSTKVHVYEGLDGSTKEVDHDDYEEQSEDMRAMGYHEIRTKKGTDRKVHKYLMSGGGIIEDYGYIAGQYIPIIMVYGKRVYINNMERVSGHIRTCKDSQRLLNVQTSKLAEISAISSVDKPIFLPEQVLGHEARWAADAVENYPYQLINPAYDQNGQTASLGPVGNTKAPELPPALASLITLTNNDLNDLTGNQQAGEQVQANMSGLAVELVQAKLSLQTSGYIDNLADAVHWCAKVWLSIGKDIFTEEGRVMRSESETGAVSSVTLKEPVINEDTGGVDYRNDFSNIGPMSISIDVGPTSESKRAATEKGLIGLMTVIDDPETKAVLSQMILANSDGEGMAEVRPYFRKNLIKMGAIEPTKDEQAELQKQAQAQQQPPPPTPEQQANTEFLQASAAKAQAEAQKIQAETAQTLAQTDKLRIDSEKVAADAELSRAKAAEIEQKLDQGRDIHTMDMVDRISPQQQQQPEPGEENEKEETNENANEDANEGYATGGYSNPQETGEG